jgi:cysteine-S-conjugate beta-lyase
MTGCFDIIIDRQSSESEKWRHFDKDVLPLWVADMDFCSPEPVLQALRARVEHGVYGYGGDPKELRSVIVDRLQTRYNWSVAPEAIVFLSGVVPGFNVACRTFASPGDAVLVQPPVYPPIMHTHAQAGLSNSEAPLAVHADGTYSVDLDVFEQAITDRTRIFLLCNPHNPVGRVFTRSELMGMAEICLRHNVMICSDEIHCDIVFEGKHVPIASLSPEIEQQTVTLMAPSKTFNIAGLKLAFAVIPNAEMRKTYCAMQRPLVGGASILAEVAALAAYRDSQDWLDQALAYLQANRDYVVDYVQANMPTLSVNRPQATFLSWIDCRRAGIPITPCEFFIAEGRVALNDGASFGPGGAGFVRLNFGCPRATLTEALERMRKALASLHAPDKQV